MIKCPWCNHKVILNENICPECKHEVLREHVNVELHDGDDHPSSPDLKAEESLSLEELITTHFKCSKCKCTECMANDVAMSGTGISKILDINYNHYLFVSCMNCGFVEVYNPDVLRGHPSGQLGTILDVLFG